MHFFHPPIVKKRKKKADDFDDDLVRGGVVYTQYQRRGRVSQALFKQKGCAEKLAACLESDNKPDKIGLISLTAKEKGLQNTDNPFFRDNNGDRAFLNTLEILVEGFLYEGLPQIADSIGKKPKDISIAIFPASRTNVREDRLLGRFRGYEYVSGMPYEERRKKNEIAQESLTIEAFAPMVQRMVEQRSSTKIPNRNIRRALAISLVYGSNASEYVKFHCRRAQCKNRKSVAYLAYLNHSYGSPLPCCPNSHCQKRLVLDVRALHYVADQILTQCFEHQEFLCCSGNRFSITKALGLLGSRYGFWAGGRIYWNSELKYHHIDEQVWRPDPRDPELSFVKFKEDFELPGDPRDTGQQEAWANRLSAYIESNNGRPPWEPAESLYGYGFWTGGKTGGNRIYWHSNGRRRWIEVDEVLQPLASTRPSFVEFEEDFELPGDPRDTGQQEPWANRLSAYIKNNEGRPPWKPFLMDGYGFWAGNRIYYHSSGSRRYCQIEGEALGLLAGGGPSFVEFKEGFKLPADPRDDEQREGLNSRLEEYIKDNEDNRPPWELIEACPECNSDLYKGKEEYELQNLYKLPDNYTDFNDLEIGEFVDEVDDDLKTIMRLSRQVDKGSAALAKAIAEFPSLESRQEATGTEPIADRKPKLRELAAQRIGKMLPDLSQNDFFIIVDDLEQKQRQEQPNR